MKKEYVLWGVKENGTQEELLLTSFKGKPITDIEQAEKLKTFLPKKFKCTDVRIQTIDFDDKIDFSKIINL